MVNMHLRHSSLDDCLSDDQFLSLFDHMDVTGTMEQRRYPPVALIECVADITQTHYKVRRLHLVIVDLWRPWKIHQAQVRPLTDQLRRLQPSPHADCTTHWRPMLAKLHSIFIMKLILTSACILVVAAVKILISLQETAGRLLLCVDNAVLFQLPVVIKPFDSLDEP